MKTWQVTKAEEFGDAVAALEDDTILEVTAAGVFWTDYALKIREKRNITIRASGLFEVRGQALHVIESEHITLEQLYLHSGGEEQPVIKNSLIILGTHEFHAKNCTIRGATDEGVTAWHIRDCSFKNCLLGVSEDSHPDGPHRFAALVAGDSDRVEFDQNVFLDDGRMPNIVPSAGGIFAVTNNVVIANPLDDSHGRYRHGIGLINRGTEPMYVNKHGNHFGGGGGATFLKSHTRGDVHILPLCFGNQESVDKWDIVHNAGVNYPIRPFEDQDAMEAVCYSLK